MVWPHFVKALVARHEMPPLYEILNMPLADVVRCGRLRWLGHVERKMIGCRSVEVWKWWGSRVEAAVGRLGGVCEAGLEFVELCGVLNTGRTFTKSVEK